MYEQLARRFAQESFSPSAQKPPRGRASLRGKACAVPRWPALYSNVIHEDPLRVFLVLYFILFHITFFFPLFSDSFSMLYFLSICRQSRLSLVATATTVNDIRGFGVGIFPAGGGPGIWIGDFPGRRWPGVGVWAVAFPLYAVTHIGLFHCTR